MVNGTHAHAPLERDLADREIWEQSLSRSRHRREINERARGYRARRKAASYMTAATLVATPMVPRTVGAASGDASDDGTAGQVDERVPVLLRYGSTGPRVADVQSRLNAVTGAGLAVDGIYGPLTQGAVRDFQESRGLADSGVVDTLTWRVLFRAQVRVVDAGTPEAAAVQRAAGEAPSPAPDPVDAAAPPPPEDGRSVRVVATAPEESVPAAEVEAPAAEPEPEPTPAPRPPAPRRPASTPEPAPSGDGCASGRMRSPVRGTITGRFGEDRGDHAHAGLDIATAAGTAIRAAQCGTVSSAGYAGGYGNMVCIRHAGSLSTCYAHMSGIGTSVGRYVRVGQVIGYVGCTGSCTGPHVHFEVRVDGRATNPVPYLNGSRRASAAGARPTVLRGSKVAGRRAVAALAAQKRGGAKVRPVGGAAAPAGAPPVAEPHAAALPASPAAQPSPSAPEPSAPAPATAEPAVSEPEPAASDPAPAVSEPEPAASDPAPAASEPEPAASDPDPSPSAPEPAASVPEPSAPEPTAPEPSESASEPSESASEPSESASEPSESASDTSPDESATEPEPDASEAPEQPETDAE